LIFIISRGYPSISEPLNGVFELDQAKALINIGHKIVFVVLDFRSVRKFRRFGFFSSHIDDIQCFHISFPLGNLETPLFNLIARKITLLGCFFLKSKFGTPYVLHSHFFQISSLAVEIKKKLDVPLVITEHSSLINSNQIEKNIFDIANRAYTNCNLLITVSNSLSKKIMSNFKLDSIVLPNIVNSIIFCQKNKKKNDHKKNEFVFVSVGTLDYNKGFDLLVKAFSLSNFGYSVKLKIIGDGELMKELKSDVKKLGLQNNVEFLGFMNREQISKVYNDCDVFVLASRGETFGLVYIEALLAGMPIIATSCGGPEDFINETNGILTPINDVEKLSESLVFMYHNSRKYDPEIISENAFNKFSPQVIAQKLSNLYQKISL
jgi:glycosyltransferase involved in cell wall biosynthesis